MKEVTAKSLSRREAAQHFDAHGIDEFEGEEVEVQAKRPLSTVLSLRLDDEHLGKLRLLAKAQGIGVTTMARRLLQQGLDRPGSEFLFEALEDPQVRRALNEALEAAFGIAARTLRESQGLHPSSPFRYTKPV